MGYIKKIETDKKLASIQSHLAELDEKRRATQDVLNDATQDNLEAAIIANESKVKIIFELEANASKPALTNKVLQQAIFNASNELGLTTKLMQSGAGHDSQEVAFIAPSAMIFIPSVGGISHSPKEFSTILDITNGTNVLLKTILAIDKGIAGLEINH